MEEPLLSSFSTSRQRLILAGAQDDLALRTTPTSPAILKEKLLFGTIPTGDRSLINAVEELGSGSATNKIFHRSRSAGRSLGFSGKRPELNPRHSASFRNTVTYSSADDSVWKEPEFNVTRPSHINDGSETNMPSVMPRRNSHVAEARMPIINDSFVIEVAGDYITHEEIIPRRRRKMQRSNSAPAMVAMTEDDNGLGKNTVDKRPELGSASAVVRQAFVGVLIYLLIGVGIYLWKHKEFKGRLTYPVVDAFYFCIVTMCTIGYGDIVPATTFTKIFTCGIILVGFGFIDILLTGLVTYVLDKQETVLLSTVVDGSRYDLAKTYFVDVQKGRMRIRMKVALALAVVVLCIGIGTVTVRALEKLSWLDAFYLTVISVTTVGYGDYAFKTLTGRLFSVVWLLVSTLAVARAFLYLAELRIDKRNRLVAKWVLQRDMTIGDLMAADLDNNGIVSKSEYVIYKLKEMGKVEEKDIMEICKQFNRLDTDNCGKITLSYLLSGH
eukprot:Gb_36011 [translate_table: standard]